MLLSPISLRWMLVLPGGLYSGQSAHGFWSYEPSPLMWTRHERLVCVARVARMPRAIQLLLQAVWEHTTCRAVFDLRATPPCSSSSETPNCEPCNCTKPIWEAKP